jgi:GT2 family glycosyltransferase
VRRRRAVRRDVLRSLGGFDASFFAYYEDVDLAWRARRAGHRFVYEPRAVSYHRYSQTSARMPGRKEFLLARNRWVVIFGNIGGPHLRSVLPSLLARELLLIVPAVRRDRHGATLRGRASGLLRVRRARRARAHLPYLPADAFPRAPGLAALVRRGLRRRRSGRAPSLG